MTQAGLADFKELEKLEEERREKERSEKRNSKGKNQEKVAVKGRIAQPKGAASNEMCTFLVSPFLELCAYGGFFYVGYMSRQQSLGRWTVSGSCSIQDRQ